MKKKNYIFIGIVSIITFIILNPHIFWRFNFPIDPEGKAFGTTWNFGLPINWVHLEVINNCFDGCFKSIATSENALNLIINIVLITTIVSTCVFLIRFLRKKISV